MQGFTNRNSLSYSTPETTCRFSLDIRLHSSVIVHVLCFRNQGPDQADFVILNTAEFKSRKQKRSKRRPNKRRYWKSKPEHTDLDKPNRLTFSALASLLSDSNSDSDTDSEFYCEGKHDSHRFCARNEVLSFLADNEALSDVCFVLPDEMVRSDGMYDTGRMSMNASLEDLYKKGAL